MGTLGTSNSVSAQLMAEMTESVKGLHLTLYMILLYELAQQRLTFPYSTKNPENNNIEKICSIFL
jgi:hypothetical protein